MLDGETRWRGSNVDLRTSSCTGARRCALMHGRTGGGGAGRRPQPELFGRHIDVVPLQAVVELKPREAEELGGARLVPMGTLEGAGDGLALDLVPRPAGPRPP